MICHNCQLECQQCTRKWYREEYTLIKQILPVDDLVNAIGTYLYHTNGHIIYYIKKSVNKSIPTNYELTPDIEKNLKNMTLHICSCCFQSGLNLSINCQQRLPFLKKDIDYFINNKLPVDKMRIYLKKKFIMYNFPYIYYCLYYRHQKPHYKSNFYWIYPFKSIYY